MRDKLLKYYTLGLESFRKLSLREKLFITIPSAFVITLIIYSLILKPISNAFEEQAMTLEVSTGNVNVVTEMLKKHARLKSRRKEIEDQYKEIESKESGITLLERLVRSKFDLPSGSFTIKDGTAQEFGGSYERTPYTVKFPTADLPALVSFLQEVVNGKDPLILKRLDMKKRGDRIIEVEMEASGIKRK